MNLIKKQKPFFRDRYHCRKIRFAILCTLLLAMSLTTAAQQRLVVVGGGKRPQAAMSQFVEWAGGRAAKILVIPWATAEAESSFIRPRFWLDPRFGGDDRRWVLALRGDDVAYFSSMSVKLRSLVSIVQTSPRSSLRYSSNDAR